MDKKDHYHGLEKPGVSVTVTVDGKVVARSSNTIQLTEVVRGRTLDPVHYFPMEDIDQSALSASEKKTHCPIKGDASYWDVSVEQRVETDLAWSYEAPIEYSEKIRGHIAFDGKRVAFHIDPSKA